MLTQLDQELPLAVYAEAAGQPSFPISLLVERQNLAARFHTISLRCYISSKRKLEPPASSLNTSGTLKLRHSTMTCSIWNSGLFFWYSLSKTRSSWPLAKWLKVKLDHEIEFRHNNGQESSIQTVLPPAPISYPLNWNQAFLERLATRNSSGWMVTTSQAKNLPNVIATVAAWMPKVKKLMNLAEFSRWEGSHQRAEVQGRNSWYVTSTDL